MTTASFDNDGFHATLGREFAVVVREVTGKLVSGQECYSAVVEVIRPPLRPESFNELTPIQLGDLAKAFDRSFECHGFTASHMARAIEKLLWHWPPLNR